MDLRRWPDADSLLDDLLALPPDERSAALDGRTSNRPELRQALAAILAEAEASDVFLDPRALTARPALGDLALEASAIDQLKPGERFAAYDVVAPAGRGSMGEVYRGHDPRLGRDVALKVLPADLAGDPERIERFDREARVLASLNHPNVGAIYGVVEERGRSALVLEFVEGQTLAEMIARGPLPLADVLKLSRQIALALGAAHQRGIVHRDLKPANIKVTPAGTVKVLDFGLARALSGQGVADGAAELTALWRPGGAALGTPAYMSPEQAVGDPAEERSDIWAFGCVVYEMLTGARPFTGENTSDVLAHIVGRDPDFGALPAATPEGLRRLLRRLFARDPASRCASMTDAVLEIDVAEGEIERRWRLTGGRRALIAGGLLAVVVIAAVVAVILPRQRWWGRSAAPVRLAVPIPASDTLLLSSQQVAALSPDGSTIVYRAVRQGVVQLFARSLDSLESRAIPGTGNGAAPFFSPDGRWVGFDGDGSLLKVSLAGGSPARICEAPGGANASWGGDVIVFASASGTGGVLHRVHPAGGTADVLTSLDPDRGDRAHAFPHVLPRGDGVLFTILTQGTPLLAALRFESRDVRVLTEGSQPHYIEDGHVVFVRNGSLWAAPFDERTYTLGGEPRAVVDRLDVAGGSAAHYAVSRNGTLLYAPPREEVRERRLVWVDRTGAEAPLAFPPKRYNRAALSHDGQRLAVSYAEDDNTDIWIGEVTGDTFVRLTRERTAETAPLWSPDDRFIVFRSDRDGGGLFRAAVDDGQTTRVTASAGTLHTPHGWAGAGQLLFTEFRSYTEQVLAAVDLEVGGVRYLGSGGFAQLRPQVSPDGRWLLYQSDESGRHEIYVRPFTALAGAVWQASTNGGTSPRWSKGGAELLYYDGRGVVSLDVSSAGATPRLGRPQRLFDYSPYTGRLGPDYDVTTDGRRFLMIRNTAETPATRAQLVVVQNWTAELRNRLAR